MTLTLWNLLLYALLAAVAIALPRPLNWTVSGPLLLIAVVNLFDLGIIQICTTLPAIEPWPSFCRILPSPGVSN